MTHPFAWSGYDFVALFAVAWFGWVLDSVVLHVVAAAVSVGHNVAWTVLAFGPALSFWIVVGVAPVDALFAHFVAQFVVVA